MKKLLFIFLTSTIIFSCSGNDDNSSNSNGTPQENYLMPLKVGNNWTYNYITYNENGVQVSSSTEIFKDVSITKINNFEYHKILLPQTNGEIAYNLRNLDASTIEGFTSSANTGQSQLMTMFKKVNTTQVINQEQTSNRIETFTAYPEQYNINGKPAYKVSDEVKENGITTSIIDYYLSPGVGYVRMERRRKKTNSTVLYTDELYSLQSYQLL